MRKRMFAVGAIMALAGVPAQAACWTPAEVAAAKVRDLDTMLMVSALRCRFEHASMLRHYNAMVVRHRTGLSFHNGQLRGYFARAHGPKQGPNELDRYITRVANRYGAGADGMSCSTLESIADAVNGAAPTPAALVTIAERANIEPEMRGGACRVLAAR